MSEQLIKNQPCELGATLGAYLGKLTEVELARKKLKFPNMQEPCSTCAFRTGTVPNRCAATVMDALKCVVEMRDFHCHDQSKAKDNGELAICQGWMLAMGALPNDAEPGKAPWDFSITEETP